DADLVEAKCAELRHEVKAHVAGVLSLGAPTYVALCSASLLPRQPIFLYERLEGPRLGADNAAPPCLVHHLLAAGTSLGERGEVALPSQRIPIDPVVHVVDPLAGQVAAVDA